VEPQHWGDVPYGTHYAPPLPPYRPPARGRGWAIALVVVLLLGGAGGGYWLAHRHDRETARQAAAIATTTTVPLEPGWQRVLLPSGDMSVALPGPSMALTQDVQNIVPGLDNLKAGFNGRQVSEPYRGTDIVVAEIEMTSSALIPTTPEGFRTYFGDPDPGEVVDAWTPISSPLGVAVAAKSHTRASITRMFMVARGTEMLLVGVTGPRGTEAAADHALLVIAASLTPTS
jgi:hypothetical protein